MTTLAMDASTMWTIGLLIGLSQFILNIVFVVVMTVVSRKAKRIDDLEAKLERSASSLIDEKMEARNDKFLGALDVLKERISEIVRRLTTGDQDLKGLAERDHKLELKFTQKVEEIKEWTHANFASKRHADSLQQQVEQLKAKQRRS